MNKQLLVAALFAVSTAACATDAPAARNRRAGSSFARRGAYAYDSDTDLAYGYICADIGDITWKITNGDGGYHLLTVLEGQHYWYSFHDGDKSWVHFDVLNATNNRFQFGGEMYTY